MVTTRTRWCFFFNRPRTSVMPFGKSKSERQSGFQALYHTSDPIILAGFHHFRAASVSGGHFQSMMKAAKNGFVHFPAGLAHLENYIVGFRC